MNAEALLEYEHLWKRNDPNWVLLKAPNLLGGYCVFNKLGNLLHIESAEVNEAVCKRMKDAGCEVLENIPNADVTVTPTRQ